MTNKHAGGAGSSDRGEQGFPGLGVAVVGVAAPRTCTEAARARSSWVAMADHAALIGERTPLRTLGITTAATEPHVVAHLILGLPAGVAAAVVLGMGPAASAVQHEVHERGGPLVITDLEALTVTVAAATINTLRRLRVPPRRGRVVLADPEPVPLLAPLLLASGVGDLSRWHPRDAAAFPLPGLMDHNDVLVDLAGAGDDTLAPGRVVRVPADPFEYVALVLPGLLSALCGHGQSMMTAEVMIAGVRALALRTPAEAILPGPGDPALVPAVAGEVSRTLDHPNDVRDHHW